MTQPIKRRDFLKKSLLSTLALQGCTFADKKASRAGRPNIIFIMTDDCSRDWLGCYGSEE